MEEEKLILKKDDFEYISKIFKVWKKEWKSISKMDFEEKITKLTTVTQSYLLNKFDTVKWKRLEYKKDVEEGLKDNVAFNIGEDKPELYIYLTEQGPLLLDSSKYDAYDKGPFERPNW